MPCRKGAPESGNCQNIEKEKTMKQWLEKLQLMAMAIAYAEVGEWNTARQIMDGPRRSKRSIERSTDGKRTDRRPRLRV
jgi:hypothetical protein